jgi:IS5 family transposase
MYRSKDRNTLPLFPELFPFGGKLEESNLWLLIAEMIPWERLDDEYTNHFSDV